MVFPNPNNPMELAIAQHYQMRDAAIKHLVRLAKEGYDTNDLRTFNTVLDLYNLRSDGFESEADYIKQEVAKQLWSL